jgi:hypothetical protein
MKSILAICVCLFSFNSFAGLLIEPLAGLNFSGVYKTEGESELDIRGASYGGRVGFQNLGFQLGLDYLNSNFDVEDDGDNLKTTEYGAFIGFKFPIFFRVYAAYIFSGTGELDTVEYKKGSGSKVGVGFTGLPFINLNLEFRSVTFAENSTNGAADVESDTDYNTYYFGISIPFVI